MPRGLAGGWNLDFAYELQLGSFSGSPSSPTAKLALLAPDGTGYDFVMQSGGTLVPDTTTGAFYAPTNLKLEYIGTLPSNLATLQSASSQWRLTDGDDTVWVFETYPRPNATPYTVGRPISKTRRDGYAWTFTNRTDGTVQTITDSFGRQAGVDWSMFYMSTLSSPPTGYAPYREAISSIALPDGTSLRYTYDPTPATAAPSNGMIERLLKVERLSSSSTVIDRTTYAYGDSRFPQHVTAITNFAGEQVASYAYDARGRGVSTALNSGTDGYTIAPTETSTELVRGVTNALGKVEDYHFTRYGSGTDIRLTSVVGSASTNTAASTRSITYGTDNFVATVTDEEGRVTTYTRDSRGRPTTIVEATGTSNARTTTITWHSTLNVPTSVVRSGLTESRTYNSAGQLATMTLTDTTSQTVPYSTNGQTRTWTYNWTSYGRLSSINGPLAASSGDDDITSYTYDTAGNNVLTMTDAAGQVTTYGSHDANGRPGTVTDPNGIVTDFTYDTMGRVQTITAKHPSSSSLDAVTSIDYDTAGRVTGITLPSADKLFMDYNAASQLTAMRAASGERRDYSYDAKGNVSGETVKRSDASISQQLIRTFDELGRLIAETRGVPRTSRWAYDKVGKITELKVPSGATTTQAFDALDRLVTTVAPDTGSTARAYDPNDNLISHTDPISVATTFVRNGFGEVIREVSPDRGTSTYWYDAAGQITEAQDGRGQSVTYTRDYLGRATQKVPTGLSGQAVSYTWDTAGISGSYGAGRLSSLTDASGTTSFAYDHRGNIIAKRQTIGSASADLAYTYDLADRITQITYPSGRIVQYAYDSKGRVSQVQTKASSSVSSWTVLASSLTYEPFGSVKAMTLGNGLSVANDWGNDGRLASRRLYVTSGGTNRSWLSYSYDANDNIGAIRDLLDDTKSAYYGYDVNDRLTLLSVVASTTPAAETLSYTSGTNRLASLTTSAGTRSISYDNRGNTSSETRPGSISVSTSYDGYGRLLTYARTGDPSQTNTYNGLDDRVTATSGSTTHAFVYDADGRVLGEYGSSASDVIGETIWLSPQVAKDNQPFGGDDGVGGYAPLAVATGSGSGAALTWIHGNHLGVPLAWTDDTGATVSPASYTLPGFPGQMKTLSDLYYNRYRDFDASTGRYIQADPIGLEGGSNPYGYAGANPLKSIDPFGLQSTARIPIPLPFPVIGGAGQPDKNGNGYGDWDEAGGKALQDFISACKNALGLSDDDFDYCVTQWIKDTKWCDNNYRGRMNVACHAWAHDELERCKKGLHRRPFRT